MSAPRNPRIGLVLMAVVGLLAAIPGSAAIIPSKEADVPEDQRVADLAQVRDIIARQDVARALSAQGLPPGEVERRLALLSSEDLHSLASNLEQVKAAGNVPNYIWILLAIFLAVSILATVF
jgi:hypothetical protein